MRLAIEISLYPLNEQYVPFIKDFIERLNKHDDISSSTGHTSTLVYGPYDTMMSVIKKEMKVTYEQVGQAIFVCKFLNATNMDLD